MVDMYIDNSEPVENVGQIHFSLEYDFQNTTLILKIIQVGTTRKWRVRVSGLVPWPRADGRRNMQEGSLKRGLQWNTFIANC